LGDSLCNAKISQKMLTKVLFWFDQCHRIPLIFFHNLQTSKLREYSNMTWKLFSSFKA